VNSDFQLRPYQERFVTAVLDGFKETRRLLAVAPTGSGKAVLMAALAKHYQPGKTLILAHTNELVEQAWDKLYRSTGIAAGIEKAEHNAEMTDRVVVGSIQSVSRRLDRYSPNHFELVIADEAHTAASDTWVKTLNHFTGAKILGVTATGFRADKKQLKDVFDKVAIDIGLRELVKDGYLSRIKVQTIPVNISLDGVKQSQGDFDVNELDDRITPYLRPVAEAIKQYASNRKTLVFVPLIKTSEAFVKVCDEIGIHAKHIDGKSVDRKQILDDFKANRFQVLCNSSLLTTGFDDPGISCVVMLRPTRSRVLFIQCIGRGTRIHPGKEDLLILDPCFLSHKFNLVTAASLICETEDQDTAVSKKIRQTKEPRDLMDIEQDVMADRERALKAELDRNRRRSASRFDPLTYAATVHDMAIADYQPTYSWEEQSPSQKQLDALSKFGFDATTVKNKGHASKILDSLFGRMKLKLASAKQIIWLTKFGYPNPDKATFEQASKFLDTKFGSRKAA